MEVTFYTRKTTMGHREMKKTCKKGVRGERRRWKKKEE